MNNNLFSSKPKNILAAVFAALYAICIFATNISSAALSSGTSRVFLSLLPPILVALRIVSNNYSFFFKKLLFPIAFGTGIYLNITSIIAAFLNIKMYASTFQNFSLSLANVGWVFTIIIPTIMLAANILCFIGSLKDFKKQALLKIGCLIQIITNIIWVTGDTFRAVASAEQLAEPAINYFNYSALIKFVFILLFYFGIFLLTTNKKNN